MGFFDSLASGAGKTLGNNLMGGTKVQIKEKKDVKGESKIAQAQADAQIKQMEAEAKIAAKSAEKEAKLAEKQDQLETINSMRFDGDAAEISENLNSLFATYKRLGEGAGSVVGGLGIKMPGLGMLGKVAGSIKTDSDKTRAAIIEKAEYGIMKLRKVDSDEADFFQQKLDAINK